ncbi:hypothetical protein H072_11350 [Dactylellina haptotyla CBS 200.50]|uniref:F-box domain-containing protein n=1 Tax=Dactylellina haptotyla (strain CBS 200.50) TaxID=1284197 RepID=S8BJ24_DACHA|nr:hypothetical protein H072_11350 [Dactylellina haptotyla CBS 200.50]
MAKVSTVSFETLPHELMLLILENTTDYPSVLSLIIASRPFRAVFDSHKDQIVDGLLLYKYEAEAILIAYLSELNAKEDNQTTWALVEIALHDYRAWGQGELPDFVNNPSREANYKLIAQNHQSILEVANYILTEMRYPRLLVESLSDSAAQASAKHDYLKYTPPATISEKDRVVRGFYHLWALSAIFNSKIPPRIGSGIGTNSTWTLQRWYLRIIEPIVVNWDFWDARVIEAIYRHISKVFNDALPDMLMNIVSAQPGREDQGEHDCRDSLEDFRNECLGRLLHFEFPALISQLTNPDPVALQDKVVADRVDRYRKTPISYFMMDGGLKMIYQPCFAIFTKMLDEFTRRYFNEWMILEEDERREIRVRPIVKPPSEADTDVTFDSTWGARSRLRTEEESILDWAEHLLASPEPKDCDFWGSLWDNWRLLEWGYEYPIFAREDSEDEESEEGDADE